MKIADTAAAVIAGERWLDAGGVRNALAAYGLELEDVGRWGEAGRVRCQQAAVSPHRFEGAFVGAISAAIILGIELARSGEVTL